MAFSEYTNYHLSHVHLSQAQNKSLFWGKKQDQGRARREPPGRQPPELGT